MLIQKKQMMIGLIAGLFLVTNFAFTNCSQTEFSQLQDGENAKVDGSYQSEGQEVVDTNGMDGTELSEENFPEIEEELQDRSNHGDTEVVFTDAESCGKDKVIVCHIPNGNAENMHDICISVNALHAHVGAHGSNGVFDHVGSCLTNFAIEVNE